MGYAMEQYGRELTPEERREKALDLAASYWAQWQWYELRAPMREYLVRYDAAKSEMSSKYQAARAVISFAYDLTAAQVWAYCEAKHHGDLKDDRLLDDPADMIGARSVWVDGTPVGLRDVDVTP